VDQPGGPVKPHIHLALTANSRAEVDAFYEAARAAGGTTMAPPACARITIRTLWAYVLDPDGHNIEAVCHFPA